MNASVSEIFRSEALEKVSANYMYYHGYVSLVVCLFGIPSNLINITVLTRRHMMTPFNFILTWMAVSDMLTMISYVPFAFHYYCSFSPYSVSPEKNSFPWMLFLLFHINFTATTHTVSIWLGVALAIFRYVHLQSPSKGSLTHMRRKIRARIVVFVIYVGSVLILIPNFASNKLVPLMNNSSIYILEDFHLGTASVKPVVMTNLLLYSVLAKFLPCVLITVYGGLLLRILHKKIKAKRRMWTNNNLITQKSYDTTKNTYMLLVVIILFVVTELPQGILILLSLFLKGFFECVYIPLGDAMDILALINNAINFFLYCIMSSDFRKTLAQMVCQLKRKRSKTRKISLPTHNSKVRTLRLKCLCVLPYDHSRFCNKIYEFIIN
ncbi:Thyrotropin-releasing hormone receptor [Mizuhopecten yessoensis]|uniref:Thyrotropin-releasing hormone receptor n=1 Tax=Mizuhopecten yessoensis TaxID=6573 RepID=A0A210QDF5_MIZYE|nr:Thyrotropin-releasing hormone receptor [Mizuhopecten yessoensis]